MTDNERIADVLDRTLCSSGYYDDWDEIIVDMIDNNVPENEILNFAKSVSVSINFVNKWKQSVDHQIKNDFVEMAQIWINQNKCPVD